MTRVCPWGHSHLKSLTLVRIMTKVDGMTVMGTEADRVTISHPRDITDSAWGKSHGLAMSRHVHGPYNKDTPWEFAQNPWRMMAWT